MQTTPAPPPALAAPRAPRTGRAQRPGRAPRDRRAQDPAIRVAWLLGPALVAGVAYLDPGNVASNMTAGARYGYLLVWVVVIANIMAWLIQYLSAKLGVVTGKSLPEVLGERIRHRPARIAYWLQAELVAMATDLAEVIGGAVALNLLFGIPLLAGGVITGLISLLLLVIQGRRGPRTFEFVIMGLVLIIATGFSVGVFIAPPEAGSIMGGLVPRFQDTGSVLLAASILGATIMPHAIYAHSALARDRFGAAADRVPGASAALPNLRHATEASTAQGRNDSANTEATATAATDATDATGATGRADATSAAAVVDGDELHQSGFTVKRLLRATRWDVTVAMAIAGTVNLCILLLAAANLAGVAGTDSLEGAYAAIAASLGPLVAALFAIGLLASGLASTSVGAYAGAEIMQGLLRIRIPRLTRRLVTLIPALIVLGIGFDPTLALVLSQVVLSFGIPFALIPLVALTAKRELLGPWRNRWLTTAAGVVASVFLIALNAALLYLVISGA